MPDAASISGFLQRQLRQRGLSEVPAVEAAIWLDQAGLLADSASRPGLPLRTLLRAGQIDHAEQRPPMHNGRWFVVRSKTTPPPVADSEETVPANAAVDANLPGPTPASEKTGGEPGRADRFTAEALRAEGFTNFELFKDLTIDRVPALPGVYVVLRESRTRPVFLARNPAGWFKGRDPTVPVAELEAAWPDSSLCVYIGKADNLRRRIQQFRRYGNGEPVGHQGGRRIWQIADADQYLIGWRSTPGADPELVEAALLRSFVACHGKKPIGNRTLGRRR